MNAISGIRYHPGEVEARQCYSVIVDAHYRGIDIIVNSYQVEGGTWTANFTLVEHRGSETVERPYYPKRSFRDREMADREALEMARRVIDNKLRAE